MKKVFGIFWNVPILILFFAIIFIFYTSCDVVEEEPQTYSIKIYGKVKDTFSGEVLDGVNVRLETSDGDEYEVETDENGNYEFEFDLEEGKYLMIKVYFNFDRKNSEYIPSVVLGDEGYIRVEETTRIDNDLVKKYDIFLKDVLDEIIEEYRVWYGRDIDEEQAMSVIVGAYRGRGSGGLNQVWVKQPDDFFVVDPHHYLDQYSDKRNNPIFDNIMEGFKAIEEYTNGFIKAPSRDDVIIVEKGDGRENVIYFEITEGEAWAGESVNDYNEIIRSGAGAGPLDDTDTLAELVSSVQGGDNESPVPSVTGGTGYVTNLDRIWGRFNYQKREPGSLINGVYVYTPDGIKKANNPYGFTYETRNFSEIQRLKNQ